MAEVQGASGRSVLTTDNSNTRAMPKHSPTTEERLKSLLTPIDQFRDQGKQDSSQIADESTALAGDTQNNTEPNEQQYPDDSFSGFVQDEGMNVLLRTLQSVGGAGQVLLGAGICYGSGSLACAVGVTIAAKGADNFQAGIRGADSYSKQGIEKITGSEQTATLIDAGIDLTISVGGLVRNVPKINELGNPVKDLFVKMPSSYEAAYKQATSTGLVIEGASDTATIYGATK
ncbi:MAG: hypothetical protein JAZ17_08095 [Candidatus Thiodiazotropha endolucinida]|nr:hypothetical protein [Candidatus Thiodiazotropha taylori]MCG8089741.1 hypothetical protein [Candidatus Thiodiazotropha taylori]MCG8093575.1 hypothetical protein [Candidatus Thiodiazotropha endolucinida]MCW4275116.1 hypothetical protein [Candidatus Thiodiazotropha taylori]MCW4328400.1 hypothetical protein [Candidatus Thiodiazotropha taylori]